MKERFDLTPAALYARVSSDRQDRVATALMPLTTTPGQGLSASASPPRRDQKLRLTQTLMRFSCSKIDLAPIPHSSGFPGPIIFHLQVPFTKLPGG